MRNSIFLLLLLFCSGNLFSQDNDLSAVEVLVKMEKEIASLESFQYSTSFESNKMGREKIEEKTYKVFAKRANTNTNYYFDWRIDEVATPLTHLFVGEDFYYTNREQKWVTIYKDWGRLEMGSYSEYIRWSNLFDEIVLRDKSEKKEKAKFSDKYTDENFWILEYEGSIGYELIWIDKSTLFPMKRMEVMVQGNLKQVHTSNIIDLKINEASNLNVSDLSFLKNGYKEKFMFKSEANENVAISDHNLHLSKIQIDSLLNFTFTNPSEDTTVQLKDSKAKLLLLDFWFISCMPCLKAMPKLQELQDQFSEEGLEVIGINRHDIDEPNSIVNKLKERGVKYKNYFGDESLKKIIDVHAYPTIILLTPEGEVLYGGLYISKFSLEELILKNL